MTRKQALLVGKENKRTHQSQKDRKRSQLTECPIHDAISKRSSESLRKFMKDHKQSNTMGIVATKRHAYAELLRRRHAR